jgi:hypothetical protein
VHTKDFPLGEIRGQISAGETEDEGWARNFNDFILGLENHTSLPFLTSEL